MPPKIIKLNDEPVSEGRIKYNRLVEKYAEGKVLDVGKSKNWDYGFPTIDTDKSLNPTFNQDICKSNLASGYFDTILCAGMYEYVDDPVKMVSEVNRLLKPKGIAIFVFVGEKYPFYGKNGRKFNGDMSILNNFNIFEKENVNHYMHLVVCQKS